MLEILERYLNKSLWVRKYFQYKNQRGKKTTPDNIEKNYESVNPVTRLF